MKQNNNLNNARNLKNDEFYTLYSDIEKEIMLYKNELSDKVIFCNCDDYNQSNFAKFFQNNFFKLNLKKVIFTSFNNNQKKIFKTELTAQNGNLIISQSLLEDNGDFRSFEIINILINSDIIITNPPFSLFRDFIDIMFSYQKKFLIIGSLNAISYKKIFKLIQENKIWLGINKPKEFIQPDGNTKKFGNICWFTNLKQLHFKPLSLTIDYLSNTQLFPKYDNYEAIEISKIKNIPFNYQGVMGVPITFLEHYNPEQFKIIGITDRSNDSGIKTRIYSKDIPKFNDLNARAVLLINNELKAVYVRILIKVIKK